MATLIPPTLPELESERDFILALRDQLDDEFTVFPNLSYLRGDDLANGEVDVLVTHRTLGFCFIEIKGGGVACGTDGVWTRTHRRRTKRLSKTPMEQVRGHAEAIMEEIGPVLASAATHGGADWDGVPWCWMLAFPRARVGNELYLTTDLPREVVIDSSDIVAAGARIRAVMEASAARMKRKHVSPEAWARAIEAALHPRLCLAPDLGGEIDAARRKVVRLDARQRTIIECVEDNDRFRVHGPAGTGKSLLALETARRWARDRDREVLLLCFNKMLRARHESTVAAWPVASGRVTVTHFHALVFEAREALGLDALPPKGATRDEQRAFWEEIAPPSIAEAAERGLIPKFDALVVDEAQDLAEDWWLYLAMVLRKPDTGPLVAFYDPAQTLYNRPSAVPEDLFTLRLHENYRNPRAVVQALAALSDGELRPHPQASEGEPLRVYRSLGPAKLLRKLEELVEGYLQDDVRPEEMVILGPRSRRNSSLQGVERIAGLEVADVLEAQEGRLLYATVPAFKGLDAPVVFFIDVDSESERCDAGVRYVGASRATHALHVFTKGAGWSL